VKLNKKKLKINYEYFIFFSVFLVLLISLNFLRIDNTKTYKLTIKQSKYYYNNNRKFKDLNAKIERTYNKHFVGFFKDKSFELLEKQIIEKYKADIVSIRNVNGVTILSKVEINEALINDFINSEFERYKSSKILTNNKFYFCSKVFNNQGDITNLILNLIDLDRNKKLVNINNGNLVVICNDTKLDDKIIFIDFKEFSKIIKDVKFHKSFAINKREFNTNTKPWNLLISLIISYVFFMIIRFSK